MDSLIILELMGLLLVLLFSIYLLHISWHINKILFIFTILFIVYAMINIIHSLFVIFNLR